MDLALGLQGLTTSTVSIPNMGLMVRKDQAVFSYLREGPPPYLIFVTNAANAVRVNFLAECKKIPEEPEKYCFWQFCCKFTHFPSVKFS